MNNRLSLTVCAVLIAHGYMSPAHAMSCNSGRGYVGTEGVGALKSQGLWHPNGEAFRDNFTINAYAAASGSCMLADNLKATASGVLQYASSVREPGVLDGKQNSALAIVTEAYLTYTPSEKVFIDIGKIKRSNGFMFSMNPLDLLRNTSGHPRSATVNADSNNPNSFYDEGSIGVGGTVYADSGTFELAALPKLTTNDSFRESAEKWSMLERTNSTNRFYGAFTTSKFSDFNPTVNMVAGSSYNALGLGVSGYVNDNLILSMESSVALGERWRHLNMEAASAIQQYGNVGDPFGQDSRRLTANLAVGLRYTDSSRTEYGIEYFGQAEGYSRSEWRNYFKTVGFVNGGFAAGLPAGVGASLAPLYGQYANLLAVETDNANRGSNFLGKHYITLFASSKTEQLRKVGWSVSSTTSLADGGTVLKANLSTSVSKNTVLHAGTSFSFGSQQSEFGQFGRRKTIYAGVRFVI